MHRPWMHSKSAFTTNYILPAFSPTSFPVANTTGTAFASVEIRIFAPATQVYRLCIKVVAHFTGSSHSVSRCRIFMGIKAIYRVLTISPWPHSTSLSARFISSYWAKGDWHGHGFTLFTGYSKIEAMKHKQLYSSIYIKVVLKYASWIICIYI